MNDAEKPRAAVFARTDSGQTIYLPDATIEATGPNTLRITGEDTVPLADAAAAGVQPPTSEADTPFGAPDCTCIPWTRQGGTKRLLGPADTVDQISGWEKARDCPHHAGISTLPHWLYRRFTSSPTAPTWDLLTDDDRSYWEHQARAVERAVKRDGFNGMDPWLLLGIDQPADGTRCTCGGRFPTLHLHADTHEPAALAAPEGSPCGPVPDACDAEAGEPCRNHEREQAHGEGEHAFCGPECTAPEATS